MNESIAHNERPPDEPQRRLHAYIAGVQRLTAAGHLAIHEAARLIRFALWAVEEQIQIAKWQRCPHDVQSAVLDDGQPICEQCWKERRHERPA